MSDFVYIFLFYVIPIAIVAFFGVSLFRYIYAKIKNKKIPGTYQDREIKNRLILLILSSVMAGALVAIVIGFIILLSLAIAYM